MTPYYQDARVTVHAGDCLAVLPDLPDASVDAVVTDPPYGLEFMGREWDGPQLWREYATEADQAYVSDGRTAPKFQTARPSYAAGVPFQRWCQQWAAECLRVLKPGGHLLAFGGTRTYHRLASGIEDAGFEIRDSITWLYGSGFPKSLDVSKAIDKQRQEDLEPAAAVARWLVDRMNERGLTRRDITEHFGAANIAQQWTTYWTNGAVLPRVPRWEQWVEVRDWLELPDEMDAEVWRLNGRKGTPGEAWEIREITQEARAVARPGAVITFDQRSSSDRERRDIPTTPAAQQWQGWGTALKPASEPIVVARKPLAGTVAANVLAHGTGALNIDACRVATPDGTSRPRGTFPHSDDAWGDGRPGEVSETHPAGRWPANVVLSHGEDCGDRCVPGCAVAELDAQSGPTGGGLRTGYDYAATNQVYGDLGRSRANPENTYGDSGGASRFFPTFRYEAKADTAERPRHVDTAHPTVKPLALMRWLVRLVTPPGGLVLDLFAGSGTTGEACQAEGFNCILVEREAEYLPLIVQRLTKRTDPVRHLADKGADLGLFELLEEMGEVAG